MAVQATDNSVDHPPCKVSMKQCMLVCRNRRGFGRVLGELQMSKPTPFYLGSQIAQEQTVFPGLSMFYKRSKYITILLTQMESM